jgi:hypothetical protein
LETYLSPAQVCELIPGMTTTLLKQLRFRGNGPRFIKPSPQKVVYSMTAIEEYMASKEQSRSGTAA